MEATLIFEKHNQIKNTNNIEYVCLFETLDNASRFRNKIPSLLTKKYPHISFKFINIEKIRRKSGKAFILVYAVYKNNTSK